MQRVGARIFAPRINDLRSLIPFWRREDERATRCSCRLARGLESLSLSYAPSLPIPRLLPVCAYAPLPFSFPNGDMVQREGGREWGRGRKREGGREGEGRGMRDSTFVHLKCWRQNFGVTVCCKYHLRGRE